ncbi:tRNA pseudouridine(55) synthase TruB [Patescibacteria group bacterium]
MENTGFILINKPSGITSHDVIYKLRKITSIKKIGHSGTLDPFATGLLIVGVGRQSTKQLDKFLKQDKEYITKIKLGSISDTFDKTGQITKVENSQKPTQDEVLKVLKKYIGEINQTPPIFSAKKIKGKKMYELARKGIKIEMKPCLIIIYEIELLSYKYPYLEIKVSCSSGTYIRSLGNDIGKDLNCGGYLEELHRTKIGEYSVENSNKLENINSKKWNNLLINI